MYYQRGVKEISNHKKICIIGAGASGLAAAISASDAGAKVCVLEHNDVAAKKLKLTGNGKCNFTNMHMDSSCYHSDSTSRISHLLERFSPDDCINFFKSLGIEPTEQFGYVYPKCKDAEKISEILISKAGSIEYNVDSFSFDDLRKEYNAVILACGSRSYKKTGSDGSGYKILEKIGVNYSRILPALCPVICDSSSILNDYPQKRLFARVYAVIDGNTIATDIGEVQIKDNGLSGIPVMNISRYISIGIDQGRDVRMIIDAGIKPDELPEIVRCRFNDSEDTKINKQYMFKIDKISRFDHAQVCTGGVSLDILDDNFMLKDIPNVYVIGEMVDVDGICGGYNLHFAFASGYIAGRAAAL